MALYKGILDFSIKNSLDSEVVSKGYYANKIFNMRGKKLLYHLKASQ